MEVQFSDAAQKVEDDFYERDGNLYDRLWEVLDRIAADPEESKHASWTNYVSSFQLWGTKIPGSTYTVFWQVSDGPALVVVHLLEDVGV